MDANPLISVIVPIYNVEEYLEECLRSLINQTYKNLEIILVNDGSPDRCGEICETFANLDTRIKVLHKANGGLSSARNYGLRYATGEFIAFLDSDDWLELNAYDVLVSAIRNNPGVEILMSNYWRYEHGSLIEQIVPTSYRGGNKQAIEGLMASAHFSPSVWCRLFRSSLIEGMKFNEGRVYEDVPFTLEAHLRCKHFVHINTPLIFYRINESSISFKMRANIIDLYLNLQGLIEKVKDTHPDWVPIINATAIRWLQGHYDDIVQSGLLSERYKEVFRNMRRYPFASDNFKNHLARWTFIHFPRLYSRLRSLGRS